MAINPLLEPTQIAHLLRVARARILVTVAPSSEDAWAKMLASLTDLPDLQVVALADPGRYLEAEARQLQIVPDRSLRLVRLADIMAQQPSDRLLAERPLGPEHVLARRLMFPSP